MRAGGQSRTAAWFGPARAVESKEERNKDRNIVTTRFPLDSLATPPLPRLVPDGVFDAFGWCASDRLEWGRTPGRPLETTSAITSANPPGMIFVLRGASAPYLPRELAALHAPGMGFEDELALAPWGIDDATDALFEHRARPTEQMWLVAQSVASLFWGLHDWAHFHNHGPFERRAWTELQCDVSALAWMDLNRAVVGIDEEAWERARREVVGVAADRFSEEGETFDASFFEGGRLRAIVASLAG
jgi:hypothetical protein